MLTLALAVTLAVSLTLDGGPDREGASYEDERCSATGAFGSGVYAFEFGSVETAERLLAETFAHQPECFLPELGSVAYWLGRIYLERDRPDAARRVWRRGMDALARAERRDLRLLDSHIAAEIRNGDRSGIEGVAGRFYEILHAACEPSSHWERSALTQRIAQVALMIDAEDQRGIISQLGTEGQHVLPAGDRCQELVRWFEDRDPFPAEPFNERVIQHLERVVDAERRFPARQPTGYDDRGAIYVRYGPPQQNLSLRYDDLRFAREVFRFGLDVSRSDFPDHEIWGYHVSGSDFTFIFVRGSSGYRLGTSLDLLPQALRQGFNHQARGQNRATAALAAMRWIYERLAIHHSGYGSIYQEIDAYDTQQEALRSLQRTVPGRGNRHDSANSVYGLDYEVAGGAGGAGAGVTPSHFIQEVMAKTSTQERELVSRRESLLPTSLGGIEGSNRLSLDHLRTARLLKQDGTTQLLVFWRDGMMTGRDVSRDRSVGVRHRARLVAVGENAIDRVVMVDTTYASEVGRQRVVHLSTSLAARVPNTTLQIDRMLPGGGWLGSGHRAIGEARPLRAISGQIEVSDLIPFVVQDIQFAQVRMREEPGIAGLDLFPDHILADEEAIGAYFEVYVPGAAAQDRDIIIAYEVVRKQAGRFLRGERVETTVLPFRRLTVGDRLPAAFLVDRAAWDGADEVQLIVTVVDELTGAEVERTLHFDVVERRPSSR